MAHNGDTEPSSMAVRPMQTPTHLKARLAWLSLIIQAQIWSCVACAKWRQPHMLNLTLRLIIIIIIIIIIPKKILIILS